MLKIGEIMLDKKWISTEQLDYALNLSSNQNTRLGEMLIQLGWIVDEQLELALKEQNWRKSGLWVI